MKSLLRTLGYTHNMLPFYAKISLCSILVALTGIAMPYVKTEAGRYRGLRACWLGLVLPMC